MSSTAYNKKKIITNTARVGFAGLIIGSGFISAVPIEDKSTNQESVYFIEQTDRYSVIAMEFFKTSMTPRVFDSFKNFIGEENFEIDLEDFDVFYPDDED